MKTPVEIRGDIGPMVQRVLGGETVFFEDLLLRVQRHGAVEDAWFTFSYSPVRVESGEVGGLLINCFETTRQVQARAVQAERDRLFDSLAFERSRLEYVFQHAPAFLAVLRGPAHVFEIANEAYYRLVGRRDILGKPALDALPEVRGQGFDVLLDNVLRTGDPFVGREVPLRIVRTPGADPETVYVDFAYLPLVEADGSRSGIIAHGHDVTEQVLARREVERLLRESEEAGQKLREANAALEAHQAEMEAVNQQLQDNALELEMQTEALLESEAKYRSLFESIDEGFFIAEVLYNPDGRAVDYRYLETNPAFAEHSGLSDPVARVSALPDGAEICVVLGDNLIQGNIAKAADAFRAQKKGAKILLKEVKDPLFNPAAPEASLHLGLNYLFNAAELK